MVNDLSRNSTPVDPEADSSSISGYFGSFRHSNTLKLSGEWANLLRKQGDLHYFTQAQRLDSPELRACKLCISKPDSVFQSATGKF